MVSGLQMDLYSCLPTYVPETFTESFGIRDHCENLTVFICVPLRIDLFVSLLLAELEVHFSLEPMKNQVRVITSIECHVNVLVFLFQ